MAVITRLHSTSIVVSDQEAAVRFYTETLGWTVSIDNVMDDSYRFVTVVPPGGGAEIALATAGMLGDRKHGSPSGISLFCDDVDATYRELSDKGVQFTMLPDDMPWGPRGAHFEDPDGNGFFLTSAP
jgi:catechol 2,3-dioxygenase-like lactoylglutathione lyase family enzyme